MNVGTKEVKGRPAVLVEIRRRKELPFTFPNLGSSDSCDILVSSCPGSRIEGD
jgi:hypothetical protein